MLLFNIICWYPLNIYYPMYLYIYLYIYTFFFLSYKLSVPTKVGVTQLRYMTHTARCMCVRDAGASPVTFGPLRARIVPERETTQTRPMSRREDRLSITRATYSPGSRAAPAIVYPSRLRLMRPLSTRGNRLVNTSREQS